MVGAESWQIWATKNGKVDDAKRQELMHLTTLYLNVGTDER